MRLVREIRRDPAPAGALLRRAAGAADGGVPRADRHGSGPARLLAAVAVVMQAGVRGGAYGRGRSGQGVRVHVRTTEAAAVERAGVRGGAYGRGRSVKGAGARRGRCGSGSGEMRGQCGRGAVRVNGNATEAAVGVRVAVREGA